MTTKTITTIEEERIEQHYSSLIDHLSTRAIKKQIEKTRKLMNRLKRDTKEIYWSKEDAEENLKGHREYLKQINNRTEFQIDQDGKILYEPEDDFVSRQEYFEANNRIQLEKCFEADNWVQLEEEKADLEEFLNNSKLALTG